MRKYLIILGLFFSLVVSGQDIGIMSSQGVVSGGGSTLLTDDLAYWQLDEASGNAVDDVSSAELTPYNTPTQNETGKLGKAVTFTAASSEYMGSIDGTFELQEFTVTAWVKSTVNGATCTIVDNRHWSGNGWSLYIGAEWDNNGAAVFFLTDGTNHQNVYASETFEDIADGAWHLVIATFDGSNVYLYVDNVQEATAAWAHTITYTDCQLTIGSSSGGTENFMDGTIDEVGVWEKVFTSDERTELWNSGTGVTYPFD